MAWHGLGLTWGKQNFLRIYFLHWARARPGSKSRLKDWIGWRCGDELNGSWKASEVWSELRLAFCYGFSSSRVKLWTVLLPNFPNFFFFSSWLRPMRTKVNKKKAVKSVLLLSDGRNITWMSVSFHFGCRVFLSAFCFDTQNADKKYWTWASREKNGMRMSFLFTLISFLCFHFISESSRAKAWKGNKVKVGFYGWMIFCVGGRGLDSAFVWHHFFTIFYYKDLLDKWNTWSNFRYNDNDVLMRMRSK